VALSAMMIAPSIASAKKGPPTITGTYVGLGDSLAFGYSQQLFNENEKTFENPAGFEHGFVSDYYHLINGNGKTQLVNYGCPGETTESLIGSNPTFIAELNSKAAGLVQEPITGEPDCAYNRADHLPLHNEYGGSKSQLEATIATIEADKTAGTPVKMVTLDIGANDELHEVAKAEKEATQEVTEFVTSVVKTAVFEFVKAQAAKEVEEFVINQGITKAFEETGGAEPAFSERIGPDIAEYAATHVTQDEELGTKDLFEYLATHEKELAERGAKFAGEYEVSHAAALHKEGEELALKHIIAALPAEYAQIDTNIIGILTAIHDTGYTGGIIMVGTYDPYGRVGGVSKEHKELQPGFNAAAAELISIEQSSLTKKNIKAKVCYSNSEALFNPASQPGQETLANEELEEAQLAAWTNMANFTKFEGKANGPDIHATPLGYEKMAEQMNSLCKF
jgi:GDSL-like Lipase/Acylhydrolase